MSIAVNGEVQNKNLGGLIKSRRRAMGYSLEQIAQQTQISLLKLKAYESVDLKQIEPSDLFLLKILCRFLQISETEISRGLAQDFMLLRSVSQSHHKHHWKSIILGFGAAIFVFLIGFVAFRQVTMPPVLQLYSPINISASEKSSWTQIDASLTLVGKTNPDSVLTINNIPYNISSSGDFRLVDIPVPTGEQLLVIKSRNRLGISSIIELTTIREN